MLFLYFFLFTVKLGNHSLVVVSIIFKNLTATFMSDSQYSSIFHWNLLQPKLCNAGNTVITPLVSTDFSRQICKYAHLHFESVLFLGVSNYLQSTISYLILYFSLLCSSAFPFQKKLKIKTLVQIVSVIRDKYCYLLC